MWVMTLARLIKHSFTVSPPTLALLTYFVFLQQLFELTQVISMTYILRAHFNTVITNIELTSIPSFKSIKYSSTYENPCTLVGYSMMQFVSHIYFVLQLNDLRKRSLTRWEMCLNKWIYVPGSKTAHEHIYIHIILVSRDTIVLDTDVYQWALSVQYWHANNHCGSWYQWYVLFNSIPFDNFILSSMTTWANVHLYQTPCWCLSV